MATGKNAKSIRKSEYKESRDLAQGFTKLVFAQKASLGDSGINLGSLTTPTEMSTLGFTNPSPSRLTDAKLFQFKRSLTLISSSKGYLMQDLSYRVTSNSRIEFEGFTADDGEIFIGVIDANPTSGIKVVDAKIQTAQGDLADGDTDFAIGFTTSTTSEEIIVFRNGLQQKRNSNNSSTVLDGNYYVVDSGSGYGSVIRFNVAPSGQDDFIFVSSAGNIVESPTDSSWDEIEKLQGQIDDIVPTLANLAGVPETTFQAQPNSTDLKQFGDMVNGLLDVQVPYRTERQSYTENIQGFDIDYGLTSSNLYWYRDGQHMVIEGRFDTGTVDSSEVRIPLPNSETVTSDYNFKSIVGRMASGWTGNDGILVIKGLGGNSYLTVGREENTYDWTVDQTANAITTSTSNNSFEIKVPIEGWAATRTLREHLQDKGIL